MNYHFQLQLKNIKIHIQKYIFWDFNINFQIQIKKFRSQIPILKFKYFFKEFNFFFEIQISILRLKYQFLNTRKSFFFKYEFPNSNNNFLIWKIISEIQIRMFRNEISNFIIKYKNLDWNITSLLQIVILKIQNTNFLFKQQFSEIKYQVTHSNINFQNLNLSNIIFKFQFCCQLGWNNYLGTTQGFQTSKGD